MPAEAEEDLPFVLAAFGLEALGAAFLGAAFAVALATFLAGFFVPFVFFSEPIDSLR